MLCVHLEQRPYISDILPGGTFSIRLFRRTTSGSSCTCNSSSSCIRRSLPTPCSAGGCPRAELSALLVRSFWQPRVLLLVPLLNPFSLLLPMACRSHCTP